MGVDAVDHQIQQTFGFCFEFLFFHNDNPFYNKIWFDRRKNPSEWEGLALSYLKCQSKYTPLPSKMQGDSQKSYNLLLRVPD
jgi:hypothetical protein